MMIFLIMLITLQSSTAFNTTADISITDHVFNMIDDIKLSMGLNRETIDVHNYQELADTVKKKTKEKSRKIYTINLHPGDYNITEPLECGDAIHKPTFIINGNFVTIDGQNDKQFMNLYCNCNISNITITNTKYGRYNSSGVIAMQNASNLKIENCIFRNNQGKIKGCVITNRGLCEINNCTFINNTSEKTGGAIWSTGEYGGQLIINNSVFRENLANQQLNHERTSIVYMVSYGNNIIENNTFTNNTGRCIHSYLNTSSTIKNNTFNQNNLTFDDVIRGGVIDNYESDLTVENNTFNQDYSVGELRGGIIYHEIGLLKFNNNNVNNNHVQNEPTSTTNCSKGGVLFNRNATIEVKNNQFNNHLTANNARGGVIFNNAGNITFEANHYNNHINGEKIKGTTIFNDVNGIVHTKNDEFKTILNGTSERSDDTPYVYNSNVQNDEGNGTRGQVIYD